MGLVWHIPGTDYLNGAADTIPLPDGWSVEDYMAVLQAYGFAGTDYRPDFNDVTLASPGGTATSPATARSDLIEDLDSTPRPTVSSGRYGGALQTAVALFQPTPIDLWPINGTYAVSHSIFFPVGLYADLDQAASLGAAGQWYPFARVPRNARVVSVRLTNESMTAGSVHIGLYRTPANGGAAIDNDCFGTLINLGQNNNGTEGITIKGQERTLPINQAFATALGPLGPFGDGSPTYDAEFDIALTIQTAAAGAKDLLIEVDYIVEG